jgi:hypothetical protein
MILGWYTATIRSVQLQQSRARQQAIFGCGKAALWGSQSWLQPPFQAALISRCPPERPPESRLRAELQFFCEPAFIC